MKIEANSYLAQFFLEREIFQKKTLQRKSKHTFDIFYVENRAVYKLMGKHMLESDSPQITTWRMRISCWITTVTDTHSEHVILTAFPR